MARIIGAIGASHTPTIGFAQDAGKRHDPVWAPIFEAFTPLQEWLAERNREVRPHSHSTTWPATVVVTR